MLFVGQAVFVSASCEIDIVSFADEGGLWDFRASLHPTLAAAMNMLREWGASDP